MKINFLKKNKREDGNIPIVDEELEENKSSNQGQKDEESKVDGNTPADAVERDANTSASDASEADILGAESDSDKSAGQKEISLEELISLCQAKVCPSCTVKKDADEARLRALADLENAKKRIQREKEEQFKYATENVLSDLIPVLDNIELAIQYGGDDPACKNILVGISMTRKIFLDIVKNHGLTQFGEVGEEFNPEIHEAISQQVSEEIKAGCIVAVHQRGYRLKDRILRPAKVVVSAEAVDAVEK